MGHVRVSRVLRARLGYFLGALIIASGAYFLGGIGTALIVLGLFVVAAFVWLYDVDEAEQPMRESRIPHRVGDDW